MKALRAGTVPSGCQLAPDSTDSRKLPLGTDCTWCVGVPRGHGESLLPVGAPYPCPHSSSLSCLRLLWALSNFPGHDGGVVYAFDLQFACQKPPCPLAGSGQAISTIPSHLLLLLPPPGDSLTPGCSMQTLQWGLHRKLVQN